MKFLREAHEEYKVNMNHCINAKKDELVKLVKAYGMQAVAESRV